MHVRYLSIAFGLICLHSTAQADVTEQEARDIAKRMTGIDTLAMGCVLEEEGTGRARWLMGSIHPSGTWVAVGLYSGDIVSYRYGPGSTPLRPGPGPLADPQSALAEAQSAATHLMGTRAAGLMWTRPRDDGACWHFAAYDRVLGAPPRGGLSADCSAYVSKRTGLVVQYSQWTPPTPEPIDPVLSREEAERAALVAMGEKAPRLRETGLVQNDRGPGTLDWLVKLAPPPYPGESQTDDGPMREVLVSVDALTGDLRRTEWLHYEHGDVAGLVATGATAAPVAPAVTSWRTWSPPSVVPQATPSPRAGPQATRVALAIAVGATALLALALRRRR